MAGEHAFGAREASIRAATETWLERTPEVLGGRCSGDRGSERHAAMSPEELVADALASRTTGKKAKALTDRWRTELDAWVEEGKSVRDLWVSLMQDAMAELRGKVEADIEGILATTCHPLARDSDAFTTAAADGLREVPSPSEYPLMVLGRGESRQGIGGSRKIARLDRGVALRGAEGDLLSAFEAVALKTLLSSDPSQVEVVVLDPVFRGFGLRHFTALRAESLKDIVSVSTTPVETDAALQLLLQTVTGRQQHVAGTRHGAGESRPEDSAPLWPTIRIFAISVDERWERKSLESLAILAEHGPAVGVVVSLCSTAGGETRATQELVERAVRACQKYDVNGDLEGSDPLGDGEFPSMLVARIAGDMELAWRERWESVKDLERLFEVEAGSGDAQFGIRVPVGFSYSRAGELAYLQLGRLSSDSAAGPIHGLIIGSTGSGKSSLLHAFIQAAAHKYPPTELQFWLADLKFGTEFNQYSAAKGAIGLPHARVLAVDKDPAFGVTLLESLAQECARRNELFGSVDTSIKSLEQYREWWKNRPPSFEFEVLPRIVCIIDECQVILNYKADNSGIEAFSRIASQGRSAGIHLLLATQSVQDMGVSGGPLAAGWKNVALRGALAADDGALRDIGLGWRPDGQGPDILRVLLNDERGDPQHDRLAVINYFGPEAATAHLRSVAERYPEELQRQRTLSLERQEWPGPSGPRRYPRVVWGTPLGLGDPVTTEVLHPLGFALVGPWEQTSSILYRAAMDVASSLPDVKTLIVTRRDEREIQALKDALEANKVDTVRDAIAFVKDSAEDLRGRPILILGMGSEDGELLEWSRGQGLYAIDLWSGASPRQGYVSYQVANDTVRVEVERGLGFLVDKVKGSKIPFVPWQSSTRGDEVF